MLIEFSVSNFRSFRDKQTLSMVAAARLRKKENVITPQVNGEKLPDLLKVAAIYGPNASGKSNLIKALDVFRQLASHDPGIGKPSLPVAPFRFDPLLADQASRFEWHFICDKQRYAFEVALTTQRITEERLTAFPQGNETLLYHRQHTATGDQYQFGAQLEGGELLHQAWRDLTGSQALFIKQAVTNSREELQQLRLPYEWLMSGMAYGANDMRIVTKFTLAIADKSLDRAKEVAAFLQSIDVPVTKIEFEASADIPWHFNKKAKAIFTHQTALGTAQFDLTDESDGTQNLIGFWAFWVALSASEIKTSNFLAIDELDSSLHPNIIATLIKQHQQRTTPAQLIFTTHDTHLMDTKLLRRDQFWLTERDANGATQLRSIHDFEGRESEDIEKRYYEGRYRGLPILRRQ